jgi:hypothetical protein
MNYVKRLSPDQVVEKVLDDETVHTNLESLIRHMTEVGRGGITWMHTDPLLNAIILSLLKWSEHEVEEEGLDD